MAEGDSLLANPEELIEEAEKEKEEVSSDAVEAFDWFKQKDGMIEFTKAVELLSGSKEWSKERSRSAIVGVTDDSLDPVQIISTRLGRHVGIIDYKKWDEEGGYGFTEYDDVKGKRNNVVCGRCVQIHKLPSDVFRVAAGESLTVGGDDVIPQDSDYEPLLSRLEEHYDNEHDEEPEEVDVAASLVSGTTISSSSAWHDGNVSGGTNISVSSLSVATDNNVGYNEITNKNYVEPQITASEGTSYTVDLSQGNYHKVTLTGDVTFDFSNVDSSDTNSATLQLVQDGTGGRTPSFSPTVIWDGGSAPSWSTGANEIDVVSLVNDQDGSQWLGFVGGLTMG